MAGNVDDLASRELLHLKREPISIEELFLDPNNPRFGRIEPTPLNKIAEVQDATRKLLDKDITDLVKKIRENGFNSIDNIVVKPLLEGNGYLVFS